MDLTHPFRVTLGQVFVDRNDMNAFACQSIQIDCHNGRQGLAFTGLHLGDVAALHNGSTYQLYMIRVFPDHSAAGFSCSRKGFRKNVIQCCAAGKLFL